MKEGVITKVSGPLVIARELTGTNINDMVRVGEQRLLGEVIEIRSEEYSIQVYEETEGIGPGQPVYPMGEPLSVELGPGLIGSIFDGIQRPLDIISAHSGSYIARGVEYAPLDRTKKWHFVPARTVGENVGPGDILGTVRETVLVEHRVMVPPGVEGKLVALGEDVYTLDEVVAEVKTSEDTVGVKMIQKWPVRQLRPVARKLPPGEPLVTGQRVIDTFFPVAKGGTSCVPGPFGSGKTVVQHQLAKWSDADIIVYVGCGERGNEMADVLLTFPELKDPRSHESLMERTVLVANTSNMPVAAREASIFTGTTIAEYYRDMGYHVALMADSTSRWAEAMREVSCRLEEMPGEEGFPTYLGSRLASFYERSGSVECLGRDARGKEGRRGSLSIIGAVSPPGGDLSEPVTQATLRTVKVFWGLDDRLASQRHFPAVNWLTSYSLYHQVVDKYVTEKIGPGWNKNRATALRLLHRESELEELVRLVGVEALSPEDKLIMEIAKMIREDFLHQNAYHELDTYTSLEKQFYMLNIILKFYTKAQEAVDKGVELSGIMEIPVKDNVSDLRLATEGDTEFFVQMERDIESQINELI
ncbi:MAG: V-type ATP synthase subunit A [Candidatus Brocadiales bacterium]|nr:V-type ATP synthase subunit A [Candidatus Bathyanammoxibius amoris]